MRFVCRTILPILNFWMPATRWACMWRMSLADGMANMIRQPVLSLLKRWWSVM